MTEIPKKNQKLPEVKESRPATKYLRGMLITVSSGVFGTEQKPRHRHTATIEEKSSHPYMITEVGQNILFAIGVQPDAVNPKVLRTTDHRHIHITQENFRLIEAHFDITTLEAEGYDTQQLLRTLRVNEHSVDHHGKPISTLSQFVAWQEAISA